MSEAIIVAFSAVLSAGISALVTWKLGRYKAKIEPEKVAAEAAKLLAEGYQKLVNDLQTQVEVQTRRIDELEQEIKDAEARHKAEIDELRTRVFELEEENKCLRAEREHLRRKVNGLD